MVEKRWLKFGDGRWEIGGEAKSGGVAEMRCRDRVMRSWRSTDVWFQSGRVKRSRRIWDVGFRSGRVIRSRRNKGWKKAWEVRWWEEEGLKSWRKWERKRWEKTVFFNPFIFPFADTWYAFPENIYQSSMQKLVSMKIPQRLSKGKKYNLVSSQPILVK